MRFTWFSAWCVKIRCGELFQGVFRSLPRALSLARCITICLFCFSFVLFETKLFNKVLFTKHNFHETFHQIFSYRHHFWIFPSSSKLNKHIAVQVLKSAKNILSAGWVSFLRAWVAIFHETNRCGVGGQRKLNLHSTRTNFQFETIRKTHALRTHYNPTETMYNGTNEMEVRVGDSNITN